MASRILIVDDSPRFRATAAALLAERGFDLLEAAADGEQALAAAAWGRPDGILLDLNLPGLDGFAVVAFVPKEDLAVTDLTALFSR